MIYSSFLISAFALIASVSATPFDHSNAVTFNADKVLTVADGHNLMARDGLSGVVENCCCCMDTCCGGHGGACGQMQQCANGVCSPGELAFLISEMNLHMSTAIAEGSQPLAFQPRVGRYVLKPFVQEVEKGAPILVNQLSKPKNRADPTVLVRLNVYHDLVNKLVNEAKSYNIDSTKLVQISGQIQQHIIAAAFV